MTLSFAVDIRPLFRDAPDIEAMKRYGPMKAWPPDLISNGTGGEDSPRCLPPNRMTATLGKKSKLTSWLKTVLTSFSGQAQNRLTPEAAHRAQL